MELVQWVVPVDDGELAIGWAPVWADRMPAIGRFKRPVRRRGAPLVSRHLPCPLAVGSFEDDAQDAPIRTALKPGALTVLLGIAADGDAKQPVLSPHADDVRFAGLFSELVRVVADLSEAAGLATVGIVPSLERRGIELGIGALGTLSAHQLGDALLLFRVAFEVCCQARGLQLTDAVVRLDDPRSGWRSVPLDGRVARFFSAE